MFQRNKTLMRNLLYWMIQKRMNKND
jgi:hypothetical protein